MTLDDRERIGGFFEFDLKNFFLTGKKQTFKNISNNNYHYFFDSSRSSLKVILDNITKTKGREILIPDYTCLESIIPVIKRTNLNYVIYNIDSFNISPDIIIKKINENTEVVLLCNYFGLFTQLECAKSIKNNFPNVQIILDSAIDSYFLLDRTFDNNFIDYEFTSLNKFFCLPDGSLLRSKYNLNYDNVEDNQLSYENNLMASIFMFLSSKIKDFEKVFEQESISFYETYKKKLNRQTTPKNISTLSKSILQYLNFQKIKKIRKSNYNFLVENLENNKFFKIIKKKLDKSDVPLVLPVEFINIDRNEVRKSLFEQNIFCPVYWPIDNYINLPIGEFAKNKIKNSLGLIIDQRYNEKDLTRLVNFLNRMS